MDRRYYRQYDNYNTVIPKVEDFPILNATDEKNTQNVTRDTTMKNIFNGIKADDVVLIGILLIFLMEDNIDFSVILGIAFLFLSEYIF